MTNETRHTPAVGELFRDGLGHWWVVTRTVNPGWLYLAKVAGRDSREVLFGRSEMRFDGE
jgi:hypothetical protein